MIEYDYFQSVKHVSPVPQSKTFEDFTQSFMEFETVDTREDRYKCFSFTQYLPGLTRRTENIKYMTGLVFDFDNKDCVPVPVRDVLQKLEEKAISYLWYHTFSYTKDQLRWRLVIPFAKYVELKDWEDTYEKGLQLIGNPPGIDAVGKKPAQIYFYPYQPRHAHTVFIAESFSGHLLNPADLSHLQVVKKEVVLIPHSIGKLRNASEADELEKIKQALDFISPDVQYIDWIKVGMALKSELGDAGMDIWDHWSQKGYKYVNRNEIIYHWNTFNGDGTKIGSLYALAKDRGFKIPSKEKEPKKFIKTTYPNDDIKFYEPCEQDIVEAAVSKVQQFICRDIFDMPCPVMKELYQWIEGSAYVKQPVYALASTISLMAFLKRNVICSPTGIKTNLYILSIGPSRTGKNNGIERINQILHKLNQESYVISNIGSKQGLISHMKDHDGVAYLNKDEISYLFGSIQNKNAQNYQKDIEELLLTFYNTRYQTSDAIKSDKIERIKDPFLHIHSNSTEQILEVLNTKSVTSGMMARFLIFRVHPGAYIMDNMNPVEDIPNHLLDDLANLRSEEFRKAIFNEDASQWFKEFRTEIRAQQQKLSVEESKMDSLFGNLAEMSVKMAMLTTPYKENVKYGKELGQIIEKWPFIRIEDIQWGAAVALYCLKNNIDLIESFSDNSHEKIYKKVVKKLKEKTHAGNWIPLSDLYKAINYESGEPNLRRLVHYLYDSGFIDMTENKRAKGHRIRWITPAVREEMENELKLKKEGKEEKDVGF